MLACSAGQFEHKTKDFSVFQNVLYKSFLNYIVKKGIQERTLVGLLLNNFLYKMDKKLISSIHINIYP